jgi:hypothetical protein
MIWRDCQALYFLLFAGINNLAYFLGFGGGFGTVLIVFSYYFTSTNSTLCTHMPSTK